MRAVDVEREVRSVVAADVSALHGLDPFAGLRFDEACVASAAAFGWPDARPSPNIGVRTTLAAVDATAALLADVAAVGGRISFATARPASLLPLLQHTARLVAAAGATVLSDPAGESDAFRSEGRAGRRLRWFAGVAVVVDGMTMIPVRTRDAADEWLFMLPRPALVVADHAFAGVALQAGIPTVALADLDVPAFAVAAARQLPVTVVPLNDRCPPAAYQPLEELWSERLTSPPALGQHEPQDNTH